MAEDIEVKCCKCNRVLGGIDPRQYFMDKNPPKNLLCQSCHSEVTTLKYKIEHMDADVHMEPDTGEVCVYIKDMSDKVKRGICIKFPYEALYKVIEGASIPCERIRGALKHKDNQDLFPEPGVNEYWGEK